MKREPINLLFDETVHQALQLAWIQSNPGTTGGVEQGGFVLQDADENLSVERWPIGKSNLIAVPVHDNCKFKGLDIVASFHTHPNTGDDYNQEPSFSDIDAVCDDINLKGSYYVGEFVLSKDWIYLIQPTGNVLDLIETTSLFGHVE